MVTESQRQRVTKLKRIPFNPRHAVDWVTDHLNAEFILFPLSFFIFHVYIRILHSLSKSETLNGTARENTISFENKEENCAIGIL